ncbi:hypothetical protein V8E36_005045 [Tilletia maclaganii]
MAGGKKDSGSGVGSGRKHAPAVSDPRFARAQNDPRFLRPKKEAFQVVLDDRFKDLLDGDAAAAQKSGKGSRKVDKYGRKLVGGERSGEAEQLRHLYRLEKDDGDEDDDEDDDEGEEEPATAGPSADYARGEAELLSSSDDDSSDEDDLPSEDDYSSVDEDELRAHTAGEVGPTTSTSTTAGEASTSSKSAAAAKSTELRGDRTRRIAVVNMDWDHIRARDLYMVFSSLVNPTAAPLPSSTASANSKKPAQSQLQVRGNVISVRVYPSEFGRERMKKEDIEGPPRDIFKDGDADGAASSSSKKKSRRKGKGKKKAADDDDDDDEEEEEEITAKSIVQVDEGGDFDEEALRKYQLERLRYYYAVAEFDSVDSASHVYNEIDGTEMERSANVFDLRFVPDDMDFPKYQLDSDDPAKEDGWRDEVTHSSIHSTDGAAAGSKANGGSKYRPLDFKTDALRHSRVKLTWDADDPERTRITKNIFAPASQGKKAKNKKGGTHNKTGVMTLDEMRDEDFKAYLASATEDEDEDEEGEGKEGVARLRAALLQPRRTGSDRNSDDDEQGASASTKKKKDNPLKAALAAAAASSSAASVWGRSRIPDSKSGRVEGEMEITFTPGLSEVKSRKELEQKAKAKGQMEGAEGEESTLDKYVRKQREKKEKIAMRAERRGVSTTGAEEDDEAEVDGGAGFDDPFFADDGDEKAMERAMAAALDAYDRGASDAAVAASAAGTKQKKLQPHSQPALAANGEPTKSKTMSKREAKLERKRKRKAKKQGLDTAADEPSAFDSGDDDDGGDSREQANFDVDVADPRFSAVLEDHRFALDPSHKAWKETKGMRKLVDERRKKARRD